MLPTIPFVATILVNIMATLFVLTCLFMMLVILIQKPKGGGLSGAFGGAGGSAQAAFGAKTGDLLTTITIGCFVVFLGLAIGLVYTIRDDVAPPAAAPPATTPINQTVPTGPAEQPTDAPDTQTPTDTTAPTDQADSTTDQTPAQPTQTPAEPPKPDAQP